MDRFPAAAYVSSSTFDGFGATSPKENIQKFVLLPDWKNPTKRELRTQQTKCKVTLSLQEEMTETDIRELVTSKYLTENIADLRGTNFDFVTRDMNGRENECPCNINCKSDHTSIEWNATNIRRVAKDSRIVYIRKTVNQQRHIDPDMTEVREDKEESEEKRGNGLESAEGNSTRDTSDSVYSSLLAESTKVTAPLSSLQSNSEDKQQLDQEQGATSSSTMNESAQPDMEGILSQLPCPDESSIVTETKRFEAEHKECLRVLPYRIDQEIVVELYVHCGMHGIPENLKADAQNAFEGLGVKLKWSDLYNEVHKELNTQPITYPSGHPTSLNASETKKITKAINEHLPVFSKHRNITALKALYQVKESQETSTPCITAYVLGKGRIPIGESEIPNYVGGYRVDVLDGFWFECANMPSEAQRSQECFKLGVSIGKTHAGSLGAIVEDVLLDHEQEATSSSTMNESAQESPDMEGILSQPPWPESIFTKTMKFEAVHKECLRVLPYRIDQEVVVVELYVHCGMHGVPEELKADAEKAFEGLGVKLKWSDLYNEAHTVLNTQPIKYPSGTPTSLNASETQNITKAINDHLPVFSKHRNITALKASYQVKGSKETSTPCITAYVLGKGRIPIGESEIPNCVGGYRVDVLDGFWFECANMPGEAQRSQECLKLGVSIGIKGKKHAGSLGAVVEDVASGALYALSCNHVMKSSNNNEQAEITHPGLLDNIQLLKRNLECYKDILTEVPGPQYREVVVDVPEDASKEQHWEHFAGLRRVKEDHLKLLTQGSDDIEDPPFPEPNIEDINEQMRFRRLRDNPARCQRRVSSWIRKFKTVEENFEISYFIEPRTIAAYTVGVGENVQCDDDGNNYFIDAAIAELRKDEIEQLRDAGRIQVLGATDRVSSECTPVAELSWDEANPEKLCKSGRTTGFSENTCVQKHSPILLKAPESQSGTKWLQNCLCVTAGPSGPLAAHGDSGAVLFKKRYDFQREQFFLSPFGIVFAVFANSNDAIASPIVIALKELSHRVSRSCDLRVEGGVKEE